MSRAASVLLLVLTGLVGCNSKGGGTTAAPAPAATASGTPATEPLKSSVPPVNSIMEMKPGETPEAWSQRIGTLSDECDRSWEELTKQMSTGDGSGASSLIGKYTRFGGQLVDQQPKLWRVKTESGIEGVVQLNGDEPYSDVKKEEIASTAITGTVVAVDPAKKTVTVTDVTIINVLAPSQTPGE